jgi:hypothetical protein
MLLVKPYDIRCRAKAAEGLGARRLRYLPAYHDILLQFQNGTEGRRRPRFRRLASPAWEMRSLVRVLFRARNESGLQFLRPQELWAETDGCV